MIPTAGTFAPPWTEPAWQEQAAGWISATLVTLDMHPTGPLEQIHVRPWSTVLRIPTTTGAVYFKAIMPALSHEPALTRALGTRFPDSVLPVLAIDQGRGWLLMPDAGSTLRASTAPSDTLAQWPAALAQYAALQQQLASDTDALLALGAADRRLELLPVLLADLLADGEALRLGHPDGLTAAEHDRLMDHHARFAADCQLLAHYRIPETLCHEDLHDANVFLQGHRLLLTDWGEACISHPFFTLLVTLRSIGYRIGVGTQTPPITALRDSYLAHWTSHAPLVDLHAAFDIAERLAMVNRALSWRAVIASLAPQFRGTDTSAVPGWLQEYLSAVTGTPS